MKREVYGPLGLMLVLMGVTLTAATNVWLVPELVASQRTPPPPSTASCPQLLPSASSTARAVASSQSASDGGMVDAQADALDDATDDVVDAPLDAAQEDAPSKSGGNILQYEAGKTALTKEQIAQIDQAATQVRNNFGLKVVIVGHGDDPSDALEYTKVGRSRAVAVMRALVDHGVSAARIAFENAADAGIEPSTHSTVELKLVPRFAEGGEKHVP